jgi:hypothetical protein
VLIENFGNSSNSSEARFPQQVATARSQVQVIDGFSCHVAANSAEVVKHLANLHEVMTELYEVRSLMVRPG